MPVGFIKVDQNNIPLPGGSAGDAIYTRPGGSSVTPASTPITSGGTAQTLFAAAARAYVTIGNPDATEDLWYAPLGVTAAVNGQGAFRLAPGQVVTIDGPEASTAISVVGATTGHKISAYGVA